MRDHLHQAVEEAAELISEGFDLNPESEAYKRIVNELYWLLSGNSDPIDDAMDKVLQNPVSVSIALDLHDLITEEDSLTPQERTKLHYAINLKVSRA